MCYIHCFYVLLQTKVPKFLGFGIPQTLNRSGTPRDPRQEKGYGLRVRRLQGKRLREIVKKGADHER